jgi:hypothetical protein
VENERWGWGSQSVRTGLVSVLGAWLPSLLWGESIITPFGFLGAIAVQSTGHQFRMLLAKTAPFVRVDICIVRLRQARQNARSCGFANADLQIMGGDEAALPLRVVVTLNCQRRLARDHSSAVDGSMIPTGT